MTVLRKYRLFAIVFVLAGCDGIISKSEGASAAEQFDIVRKSGGSAAELCESARKAAAAYLSDSNQVEYQRWNGNAAGHCSSAAEGAEAIERLEESLKAADDAAGEFMSGSSR